MSPHSLIICPVCNVRLHPPQKDKGPYRNKDFSFFDCPYAPCAQIRYLKGIFDSMTFYQGSLCIAIYLEDNEIKMGIDDFIIDLPEFDIFNMEPVLSLIKTLKVFL